MATIKQIDELIKCLSQESCMSKVYPDDGPCKDVVSEALRNLYKEKYRLELTKDKAVCDALVIAFGKEV